jgi:hypothetical protein
MKPDNPKLFRRVSEPYPNAEAAAAALEAFAKDVSDLREKHRVMNVVVLMQSAYERGEDESRTIMTLRLGSETDCLAMQAQCFGIAQERARADLADLVAAGRKLGREEE